MTTGGGVGCFTCINGLLLVLLLVLGDDEPLLGDDEPLLDDDDEVLDCDKLS